MAAKRVVKGEGGTLEDEIDALFQLTPAEFTAARNALTSRLKKAGRADDAEQVKGLVKPPVTAWAVNQLYWKHRDAFDRLIETSERFRKAQASQLAGKPADMRGPLEARRTALAELSKLAAATDWVKRWFDGYNHSPVAENPGGPRTIFEHFDHAAQLLLEETIVAES